MDEKILFDQTISAATRALDLRSRRHELIISNLANADTPGYKAFDMLMDKALADDDRSRQTMLEVQRTHPQHLPTARSKDSVKPYVVQVSDPNNLRGDGNTVDMDREMSNLASNQLLYKASAKILSKKFSGLLNVIKGGDR